MKLVFSSNAVKQRKKLTEEEEIFILAVGPHDEGLGKK